MVIANDHYQSIGTSVSNQGAFNVSRESGRSALIGDKMNSYCCCVVEFPIFPRLWQSSTGRSSRMYRDCETC